LSTIRSSEADETEGLLLRIQGGDKGAFDELFARHRAEVHEAVATRLGPSLRARLDPSDVVRETQLDAVKRLAEFIKRRPMPFRLWLLRTAIQRLMKLRRQASAARRDIGRERPLPALNNSSSERTPAIAVSGLSPSQQAVAADSASRLQAVLERLAEVDREILRMRAFEGLSYEEAATKLAIEPATARKRYGRALLRLRVLLLADGLTESRL
jgi:RNA polymerase sigma-70 factor, ECF subfamily